MHVYVFIYQFFCEYYILQHIVNDKINTFYKYEIDYIFSL